MSRGDSRFRSFLGRQRYSQSRILEHKPVGWKRALRFRSNPVQDCGILKVVALPIPQLEPPRRVEEVGQSGALVGALASSRL